MIDARKWIWIPIVCLAIGLVVGVSWPGCKPTPEPKPPAPVVVPEPVRPKPTAATYVFEKDSGGVPSAVAVGINRLNRERGILATTFEADTTDGTGDVPDQYRVALDAARLAGLPALVVTAGSEVLEIVKDPRTTEQVMEAVE